MAVKKTKFEKKHIVRIVLYLAPVWMFMIFDEEIGQYFGLPADMLSPTLAALMLLCTTLLYAKGSGLKKRISNHPAKMFAIMFLFVLIILMSIVTVYIISVFASDIQEVLVNLLFFGSGYIYFRYAYLPMKRHRESG